MKHYSKEEKFQHKKYQQGLIEYIKLISVLQNEVSLCQWEGIKGEEIYHKKFGHTNMNAEKPLNLHLAHWRAGGMLAQFQFKTQEELMFPFESENRKNKHVLAWSWSGRWDSLFVRRGFRSSVINCIKPTRIRNRKLF